MASISGIERAKTPARSGLAISGMTRSGAIFRHFDSTDKQYKWKEKAKPTTTWTTKRY